MNNVDSVFIFILCFILGCALVFSSDCTSSSRKAPVVQEATQVTGTTASSAANEMQRLKEELGSLRKELIELKMARYNPETGNFELLKQEGNK